MKKQIFTLTATLMLSGLAHAQTSRRFQVVCKVKGKTVYETRASGLTFPKSGGVKVKENGKYGNEILLRAADECLVKWTNPLPTLEIEI